MDKRIALSATWLLAGCSLGWDYEYGSPDAGCAACDAGEDDAGERDAGGPVGDCADPAANECDQEPFACVSEGEQGGHRCTCPPGYEGSGIGAQGCVDLDECAAGTANCDRDPLTTCTNTVGGFTCGPCPEGFAGDAKGEQGCLPVLSGLAVDGAPLVPAFDPEVTAYTLDLRPWQSRVDITPRALEGLALQIDGAGASSGQAATVTVDESGRQVLIDVVAGTARRTYTLDIASSAPRMQAYLKSPDRQTGATFSYSLGLSADGRTIAAGAFVEDGPDGVTSRGAVYVYTRGDDGWGEPVRLLAPRPVLDGRFGQSLDLDAAGETLVIGEPGESSASSGVGSTPDDGAPGAGAVHVYRRNGQAWERAAYLKASNPDARDDFGAYVAISRDGSTIAVGSRNEDGSSAAINGPDDDMAAESGAVYVFVRTGASWSQQAYLKHANAGPGDKLGAALALSADGNVLLAGAPFEDSGTTGINSAPNEQASNAGAAYVFRRAGSSWQQSDYLKASNTGAGDTFGGQLAISPDGTRLAVASPREAGGGRGVNPVSDEAAPVAGAVYVFRHDGTRFRQDAYVKSPDARAQEWFGEYSTFNRDGSMLFVGAVSANATDASGALVQAAGAVYVYSLIGGTWNYKASLAAPFAADGDNFGDQIRVADDDRTVVVGAGWEDSSSASNQHPNRSSPESGALYVF